MVLLLLNLGSKATVMAPLRGGRVASTGSGSNESPLSSDQ